MKGRISFVIAVIATVLITALAASVFLFGLDFFTRSRENWPLLFLLAPVVGALTAWSDVTVGRSVTGGNKILFRQVREAASHEHAERALNQVPRRLAPLIVLFTWLSHIAGLSVGREGTAIQMGGGIAAAVGRKLNLKDPFEHVQLLKIGLACGFAAVFGVPFAGAVFAIEVSRSWRTHHWRKTAWIEIPLLLICTFAADKAARYAGASHLHYSLFWPLFQPFFWPRSNWMSFTELKPAAMLIALPILAGALAWIFIIALESFRGALARVIPNPMARLPIAGLFFAPLAFFPAAHRYAGLGADIIQQSFLNPSPLWDPFAKLITTVYSVGSSFRGGEVTPLLFMGSTLGSAWAGLFGLPPHAFAALGFSAVFAAATGTPCSSAVMAAEFFGIEILPFALAVNWLARQVVRRPGLFEV
jgi:H+/Cl- antiporter ClcA